MTNQQRYASLSLEQHLFFARIMKEHALFLEAGFTPKNPDYTKAADQYKGIFESVLSNAVQLANGIMSTGAVSSGELITDYTLGCEQKTQNFTGIQINTDITQAESRMYGSDNPNVSQELIQQVRQLNAHAKHYLDGLIEFKRNIWNNVVSCHMFIAHYALIVEHMIHEAELYRSRIADLENGTSDGGMQGTQLFWNQNMMEHAQFTRGLLDPSESTLIATANSFADAYADLLNQAKAGTDINNLTQSTLQETVKYQVFETAGTKGIAECKVRSVILPLLADHDLREANHYLRLLRQSV